MTQQTKLGQLLYAKSAELNLFSRSDRELIGTKHLPDALAFKQLNIDLSGKNVIDLGTGGGLPGLALALEFPDAKFCLVDARAKKIKAVSQIGADLGLENANYLSGRLEDLAHEPEFREQFDLALARALAPLPILLEYACGFLPVGGLLVAWKGQNADVELIEAKKACTEFGFELERKLAYSLDADSSRELLVFRKTKLTTKDYPRKAPLPRVKPII